MPPFKVQHQDRVGDGVRLPFVFPMFTTSLNYQASVPFDSN